jgi:hypothetical protein
MKKENFIKTNQAIHLLSEVLTNYEYGESHDERIHLLNAFNTLSDLIQKPKGKNNLKKIDSFMGAFYVYFNEYQELVILDSDKKQIALFENMDESKAFDIYNQLESMGNPMKLLDMGFCAEVYFDNDMENFVKNLKKYDLFETSNPQSEIFRVGLFFVFFVY